MGWKDWSYWLRGGVMGLVISSAWALQGAIRNGLEHANRNTLIFNLLIAIILATILGVIIGFIYGKIKLKIVKSN